MTTPLLVDRSRLETHWRCPRRRYWNYDYDGTGIAPIDFAWPLQLGILCHQGAATLARAWEGEQHAALPTLVDEVRDLTCSAFTRYDGREMGSAEEWGAWAGGIMAAMAQRFLPRLFEDYEPVLIEGELYCDLPGDPPVRVMVSPDMVLRHRVTKALCYLEYKTTGARDTVKWASSWKYQPQLHLGCRAIAAHFREPCQAAIVQGWQKPYKGYGRLNSSLIHGYRKNGTIQRKYKYGWERFVVDQPWAWMETFSQEEWSDLFPQTLPIAVNDQLLEQYCRQIGPQERALTHKTPEDLDRHYPQTFTQCLPSFGERCPFVEACHIPAVRQNPLGSSFYTRRRPHHRMEKESA